MHTVVAESNDEWPHEAVMRMFDGAPAELIETEEEAAAAA